MSELFHTLYRLKKSDLNKASITLFNAFHDDPFANVFIPSEAGRVRYFIPLLKFFTKYGLKYGEVISTSKIINDISILYKLKNVKTSIFKALLSGYIKFQRRVSKEVINRVKYAVPELEKTHASIINTPHWYLNFIAVDPKFQGKGHGTTLLKNMLRQIDIDGLSCYLETWVKKNVEWYQKYDFKVMKEIVLFDCQGWAMLRG